MARDSFMTLPATQNRTLARLNQLGRPSTGLIPLIGWFATEERYLNVNKYS